MFAFFSIGIDLDLNELLHVQAQIPQEQRICGCYCFCENATLIDIEIVQNSVLYAWKG